MTGVLLNAGAQLLLKAGTNALGVITLTARQLVRRRCWRMATQGYFVAGVALLRGQPGRVDPRAVARAGVDRLSDALARLRGQRDRRALSVRRGGHACSAGSASASSSSACAWWREADRWPMRLRLSVRAPADRRGDDRRRRRGAALGLDHERPAGPALRGRAVDVLRRPAGARASPRPPPRSKSRCSCAASARATKSSPRR